MPAGVGRVEVQLGDWDRESAQGFGDMVEHWSELGFILKEGGEYVEKERTLP